MLLPEELPTFNLFYIAGCLCTVTMSSMRLYSFVLRLCEKSEQSKAYLTQLSLMYERPENETMIAVAYRLKNMTAWLSIWLGMRKLCQNKSDISCLKTSWTPFPYNTHNSA